MPTGIFKRTQEHKDRIAKALTGLKRKPHSVETRKKMSESHKGLDNSHLHSQENILKRKISLTGRVGVKMSEKNKHKLRDRMIGAKNPNWNNGSTSKKELLRGHGYYKEWRTSVFERDNYTCLICNKRGGYLEVDHIKPLFEIIVDFFDIENHDEFIKNVWAIPIMRDINNGRTLCKGCHKNTSTWGSKYRWSLRKLKPLA